MKIVRKIYILISFTVLILSIIYLRNNKDAFEKLIISFGWTIFISILGTIISNIFVSNVELSIELALWLDHVNDRSLYRGSYFEKVADKRIYIIVRINTYFFSLLFTLMPLIVMKLSR